MRDLREYLRAYRLYISTTGGWAKALATILFWLAGIFAPFGARTFIVDLPNWLAIGWMTGWSVLGYVFAPYGMWRHHRAQIASSNEAGPK